MPAELVALAVVSLLTGLIWVPYTLEAVMKRGLWTVLDNPKPDPAPLAPWAARMNASHANAVENLVVFAALVLAVHAADATSEATAMAAWVYVCARVVHLLVYTAGIPVVRTLAFVTGFGCQVVLALAIIG